MKDWWKFFGFKNLPKTIVAIFGCLWLYIPLTYLAYILAKGCVEEIRDFWFHWKSIPFIIFLVLICYLWLILVDDVVNDS